MIKSVRTNNRPSSEKSFPKLMKSLYTDVIVLFLRDRQGTVVSGVSKDGHTIGQYVPDWNMFNFIDYDGEITLSNT